MHLMLDILTCGANLFRIQRGIFQTEDIQSESPDMQVMPIAETPLPAMNRVMPDLPQ